MRRWWAHRFRTRVRPGFYNPNGGQIVQLHEGEPFRVNLLPGWTVERRDWWTRGSWSGVTDATVEAARARLDVWQDEQAARNA